MSEQSAKVERLLTSLNSYRHLLLPVGAAALVFVLLVPVPAALMNVLLIANLALAAIILLTTISISKPMEFSSLPTVLLGATLLRLVLNVALTRLILTAGGDGGSVEEARHAAGSVVWAFSEFVTSGSLVVGMILFAIIIVIQFVVVTKGATRISEVAARFMLDAMPGKQIAVDAELSGGLITQEQASARRKEIAHEADFYGAMDGASKFLRGDAIAAIIITLINLVGGIYVGMVQNGWEWSRSVDLFSRLTIGDGLVTQIPAFIVAIAAAMVATRSTSESNLSDQVATQLFSRPVVLLVTAGFLGMLSLVLPPLPILLIAGGCTVLALVAGRDTRVNEQPEPVELAASTSCQIARIDKPAPADVSELLRIEPLRVDIGLSLVGLMERSAGGMLEAIEDMRRSLATELGIVLPSVQVRDDLELRAHEYVIRVRSSRVAFGRIYPDKTLMLSGEAAAELSGRRVREPASGAQAVWLDQQQALRARHDGAHLLDPLEVLVRHLASAVRAHAHELLTRQQTSEMVDGLRGRCPTLVNEVLNRFRLSIVQKVLQALLREGVAVHDLETILEAMTDWPGGNEDLASIVEHVRGSMSRTLSQQYCSRDGKLWCVSLAPHLEDEIASQVDSHGGQASPADEQLRERVERTLGEALRDLRNCGHRGVVLCSPTVRQAVRDMIAPGAADAAVLAYNEVNSVEVQTFSYAGMET